MYLVGWSYYFTKSPFMAPYALFLFVVLRFNTLVETKTCSVISSQILTQKKALAAAHKLPVLACRRATGSYYILLVELENPKPGQKTGKETPFCG